MSEVRLIDANAYAAEMKVRQDALKEEMDDAEAIENWEMYDGMSRAFSVFVEAKLTLDAMPTVDAVPVAYIYEKANELKNDGMIYAYTVLIGLIANYRADGERKDDER